MDIKVGLWVKDEKGFYRMEPQWNIISPIFWHFIFKRVIWNIKKDTLPAFNMLFLYKITFVLALTLVQKHI